MSTELVQVLQESQIPAEKKNIVKDVLQPFLDKAEEWKKQAETIKVTDPSQTDKMALAKTGRLQVKNWRLDLEKRVKQERGLIKARMADDVLEDKLWLHSFQIMEAVFKNVETILENEEKFAERYQAELEEKLRAERTQILAEYGQPEIPGLGKMLQDQFDMYIAGVKAKFEADKKAEEERIEAQRIENLHNERRMRLAKYEDFIPDFHTINFGKMSDGGFDALEKQVIIIKDAHDKEQARIKAENERLQKEKDDAERKQREALEKAEQARKEAEAKAQAEQKRIQDEADAKAEKIRNENEAKLQAEQAEKQKAIDEANRLKEAEQKRIQDEAKAEADRIAEQQRIAQQGETERLIQWVESFTLPSLPSGEYGDVSQAKAEAIFINFVGFKKWAKDTITNK